jgi:hypothetical protein
MKKMLPPTLNLRYIVDEQGNVSDVVINAQEFEALTEMFSFLFNAINMDDSEVSPEEAKTEKEQSSIKKKAVKKKK